jgi:flagellar biosynthesis protein FliR
MPIDLLYTWMMVFLRGLGIMLLFPTLGSRPLPPMVRVALSALISGLLYGIVPHVSLLPAGNGGLIFASVGELVLGLVLGFSGRLIFYAVEMTGRMITQEIGLMAAPGIDAPAPSSEPLAAFLSTFAGVMFFGLGGHLGALSAFARSFEFAPAGAPAFGGMAAEHLVAATGRVIELGFRMAAPFMAMNFLITLSFSVLGRAVPRMNVFILSYPVRVIVGMVLLAGSGALLTRYLQPEFNEIPYRILEIVARS